MSKIKDFINEHKNLNKANIKEIKKQIEDILYQMQHEGVKTEEYEKLCKRLSELVTIQAKLEGKDLKNNNNEIGMTLMKFGLGVTPAIVSGVIAYMILKAEKGDDIILRSAAWRHISKPQSVRF